MVVLSIFSRIFFLCQQYKLFFHWHLFFYFISNNNCRLLTINIVSFIFFYYRESKPPFCLHYEKSSPLNIVYRKINWQNPASISAYTQSEYRISNYVNHIRIIILNCTTWLPHLHVFFTNKLHIVQVPSVVQIVRNKKKIKKKIPQCRNNS
jgi:hypothetical protein